MNADDRSSVALRAYFRVARAWDLDELQQRALLGSPGDEAWKHWMSGEGIGVSENVLHGISDVLAIYRALAALVGDEESMRRWLRVPNHAPLFAGQSALDMLVSGTGEDLQRVRQYLQSQFEWG